MTTREKLDDIQNRYSLALAERQIYEKGSKEYEQLSHVAKMILKEYQNPSKSFGSSRHPRYGFRLYGTNYHLVTLCDCEKV